MAVELRMPALSPTMETGKLARWLVSEGDTVAAGDIIAEIETDKAVMEFEAPEDGRMGQCVVAEGAADIPVHELIGFLLTDGEESPAVPVARQQNTAQASPPAPAAAASVDVPSSTRPSADVPPRAALSAEIPEGAPRIAMTVREALRMALAEEMRADGRVIIMGEEVAEYEGAYKITQGLLEEFGPERVIDTPITEYGFAGVGVGAAFAGLRPVVEFMTFNFAMQAIDHIINSAAKTLYMSGGQMRCPIVFRGPNGAAARVGAQHSQDFAPWYAHAPGLRVVAPYSAADARGLLRAAIRDPNPVVVLEHEILYAMKSDVPDSDDFVLPLGRAATLREGTACTLVSYGHGLVATLAAADHLGEDGLACEVINLRSLRPLDMDAVVASVRKTGCLVVVEECWPVCGIGAEVCAETVARAFDFLDAPPTRVSGRDTPMPYAANLERLALPSVEDVIGAVRAVCYAP